jgi:hypothetical protein
MRGVHDCLSPSNSSGCAKRLVVEDNITQSRLSNVHQASERVTEAHITRSTRGGEYIAITCKLSTVRYSANHFHQLLLQCINHVKLVLLQELL